MAKICPLTSEPVLYLECKECEQQADCKTGRLSKCKTTTPTTVHDFDSVLNSIIDERFPNTERHIVSGGDSFKDMVIGLKESGKELRYSPYKLFEKSRNYEDTIEELIAHWQTMLQQ